MTVGGPIISSLSQSFASNNTNRVVVVTGENFKADSVVFLGSLKLNATIPSAVVFDSPTQLTLTIPAGLDVHMYKLQIVNPSGEKDTLKQALKVRVGFDADMTKGDHNIQLKALKKRLIGYGFFHGKVNPVFDTPLENALQLYQKSLGLATTGRLDFLTRNALNTNQ